MLGDLLWGLIVLEVMDRRKIESRVGVKGMFGNLTLKLHDESSSTKWSDHRPSKPNLNIIPAPELKKIDEEKKNSIDSQAPFFVALQFAMAPDRRHQTRDSINCHEVNNPFGSCRHPSTTILLVS